MCVKTSQIKTMCYLQNWFIDESMPFHDWWTLHSYWTELNQQWADFNWIMTVYCLFRAALQQSWIQIALLNHDSSVYYCKAALKLECINKVNKKTLY